GEPVIAAWGYEADAVTGLAAFAPPPVPVPARPSPAVLASATGVTPPRPPGLGAVAECAAVRPLAPAAAPDHLVDPARLRPGRSLAQHRHPGGARAARARATARSYAAVEGLARFGGGRPEQAQGRTRRPRGRTQGQGGDVQADRAAQAAAATPAAAGGQRAATPHHATTH